MDCGRADGRTPCPTAGEAVVCLLAWRMTHRKSRCCCRARGACGVNRRGACGEAITVNWRRQERWQKCNYTLHWLAPDPWPAAGIASGRLAEDLPHSPKPDTPACNIFAPIALSPAAPPSRCLCVCTHARIRTHACIRTRACTPRVGFLLTCTHARRTAHTCLLVGGARSTTAAMCSRPEQPWSASLQPSTASTLPARSTAQRSSAGQVYKPWMRIPACHVRLRTGQIKRSRPLGGQADQRCEQLCYSNAGGLWCRQALFAVVVVVLHCHSSRSRKWRRHI